MGNQPSSRLRGPPRIRSDVSNALGLSKAELDERCKPSGLYSTCNWDEKTIRRLIGDGKLASRPPSKETDGQHECPICFFHYSQINVTVCCQASICTECYLQLQPYQKPNASSTAHKPAKTQVNVCPFCNAPKLSVTVAQMKTPDPPPVIPEAPESNPSNAPPSPTTGFGSSLAQNPRVAMMRARSCSVASSSNDETANEMACMTPQERHVLENEMRAQHLHPLALRLEQEEAERRLRNELEFAARRRGGTASSSLHPRQVRAPPPLALPGLTEEQQMALAIAASLQESARTPSTESA